MNKEEDIVFVQEITKSTKQYVNNQSQMEQKMLITACESYTQNFKTYKQRNKKQFKFNTHTLGWKPKDKNIQYKISKSQYHPFSLILLSQMLATLTPLLATLVTALATLVTALATLKAWRDSNSTTPAAEQPRSPARSHASTQTSHASNVGSHASLRGWVMFQNCTVVFQYCTVSKATVCIDFELAWRAERGKCNCTCHAWRLLCCLSNKMLSF